EARVGHITAGSGTFTISQSACPICGTWAWSRSGGGTADDVITKLTVDNSGNTLVVGYTNSNPINFSGTSTPTAGYYDLFLAKYDPSGNLAWLKTAGGSSYDVGTSVAVDAS